MFRVLFSARRICSFEQRMRAVGSSNGGCFDNLMVNQPKQIKDNVCYTDIAWGEFRDSSLMSDDAWVGESECGRRWINALKAARRYLGLSDEHLLNEHLFNGEHIKSATLRLSEHAKVSRTVLLYALRRRGLEPRAVVPLLVSRAAASANSSTLERHQRTVAASAELVHLAALMHRSVSMYSFRMVNERSLLPLTELAVTPSALDRLLIMTGDLLLSMAFAKLSSVSNSRVFGILARTVGQMSEGHLSEPASGAACWARRHHLLSGAQLAASCRALLLLDTNCGRSQALAATGSHVGRLFSLAWQARADIEHVQTGSSTTLRMTSLPMALLMETDHQQSAWLRHLRRPLTGFEQQTLRQLLLEQKYTEQAKIQLQQYVSLCRQQLQLLPEGPSVSKLHNLLDALSDTDGTVSF